MDLINPDHRSIATEDIAHHLANIARFNGATDSFYSVAAHSWYCSMIVKNYGPEVQLLALMHDAAEAYLGDVTSPLKCLLREYQHLERRMWYAIADAYGLNRSLPPCVKEADTRAYVKERMHLISSRNMMDDPDAAQFEDVKVPALALPGPDVDAKQLFLDRYYELRGMR